MNVDRLKYLAGLNEAQSSPDYGPLGPTRFAPSEQEPSDDDDLRDKVTITIKSLGGASLDDSISFGASGKDVALLLRELPSYQARVVMDERPQANAVIKKDGGKANWQIEAAGIPKYQYFFKDMRKMAQG